MHGSRFWVARRQPQRAAPTGLAAPVRRALWWVAFVALAVLLSACSKEDAEFTALGAGGPDHTPVVLFDLGITSDAEVDEKLAAGQEPWR